MVIQMLAKIEAILLDEKTKDILSRSLICSKTSSNLENPVEVLRRKYGYYFVSLLLINCLVIWLNLSSQMEEWLVQGPYSAGSNPSNYSIRTLKKILEPLIMNNPDETFLHLKTIDLLTNWFRQPKDISGRMMARIQNLAESISKRVGWSFLIDPGRLRTDLSVRF
jgi:hypothetical protein